MLIFSNSNQRTSGNPSNFIIQFPHDLIRNQHPLEVELSQCIIPYTFGSVMNNDYFKVIINVTTYTILFGTTGYFSITDFLTVLKQKLDTGTSTTWTLTYSKNTNQVTYKCSGLQLNTTLKFDFTGSSSSSQRLLYKYLGFEKDSVNTFTISNNQHVITSVLPVEMNDSYIDIVINTVTSEYNISNSYHSNVFARIPLHTVSYGSPIVWQNVGLYNTKLNIYQLQQLHIMLLDSHGNILSSMNNDWSFTLKINEIKPNIYELKALEKLEQIENLLKDILILKEKKLKPNDIIL